MTGPTTSRGPMPVPTSLSPAAQAYLTKRLESAHPPVLGPPEDDVQSWLDYVERAASGMHAMYAQNEALGVEHEARDIGGMTTYELRPPGHPEGALYVDVHGGGFALGGGDVCRLTGMAASARTGLLTWSADYRLPPLHPFPAGLDDMLTIYRAGFKEFPASRVIVGGGVAGGGSAGGNLAARCFYGHETKVSRCLRALCSSRP